MRLYPKTREEADRLKADYEFLGVDVRVDGDALVVYERKVKKKKDKNDKKKPARRRDS